jgi:hypothetical protein
VIVSQKRNLFILLIIYALNQESGMPIELGFDPEVNAAQLTVLIL